MNYLQFEKALLLLVLYFKMSQYLVVEAQEARKSDLLYRKFHMLNVTNLLTFNYAENISYSFYAAIFFLSI